MRLALGVVIAAAAAAGCSRSNIAPATVSPSEVRCPVSLSTTQAGFGSTGGPGVISFNTPRECVWTARADVGWIASVAPPSGQGSASLQFRVLSNSSQSFRRGTIHINDTTVEVEQQGMPVVCEVEISPTSRMFDADGGSGRVDVEAPTVCSWQVSRDASWLDITSSTRGSGDGSVQFDVEANPGDDRTGRLTIGGKRFTVTQAAREQRCDYDVTPTALSIGAAGGTRSVAVVAADECDWRVGSVPAWITLASSDEGSGEGAVRLAISENRGEERTAGIEIAGTTVRIRQSGAPCTFSLSPTSESFDSDGGDGTTDVMTGGNCSWTAVSEVSWIRIRSGSSGTGPGTVRFRLEENRRRAERTGTLTIGGLTYTAVQAGDHRGNGGDDEEEEDD